MAVIAPVAVTETVGLTANVQRARSLRPTACRVSRAAASLLRQHRVGSGACSPRRCLHRKFEHCFQHLLSVAAQMDPSTKFELKRSPVLAALQQCANAKSNPMQLAEQQLLPSQQSRIAGLE